MGLRIQNEIAGLSEEVEAVRASNLLVRLILIVSFPFMFRSSNDQLGVFCSVLLVGGWVSLGSEKCGIDFMVYIRVELCSLELRGTSKILSQCLASYFSIITT